MIRQLTKSHLKPVLLATAAAFRPKLMAIAPATFLATSLAAILASVPALAGDNSDLEVFGRGITKSNPQGFNVAQGYSNAPAPGSMTIPKDALEHGSWYRAPRQFYIVDDGPTVSVRGGGGARAGLTPASFGGSNAMSGAVGAPRNLTKANPGPFTRPEPSQARPIMHTGKGATRAYTAPSNAMSVNASMASHAPAPAPSEASYGGYRFAPAAAAASAAPAAPAEGGSDQAHTREVKARLLGHS